MSYSTRVYYRDGFFLCVNVRIFGKSLFEKRASSLLQLNYLVANHPSVSGSTEFQSLPTSCSASDTTRLHFYCLQRKIRGKQLRTLMHRTLSDALHSHYRGAVSATNPEDWLQTSSIPAEQQSRILDII